ncbi:MAG TPA: PqqD family protein [Solirubrobacteraceae bacterium]|nr:PqqD family protein [Solirubrobacteraceae bacterium]
MSLRLRTEDLQWREIDREIVALDGRDASYLTVNGSGALLWRMLATSASRDELVRALVETYEVEAATAEADTDAFLRTLSERGLLGP